MARHLRLGTLRELTLTTNGTQPERPAEELASCGVRRVNVSLDTLDAEKFARIPAGPSGASAGGDFRGAGGGLAGQSTPWH
ncbi:hypothetical protein AP073_17045 [Rhodobacter capsulatus]|nr:hypothetical protein AP073_17045 [Rhodobacter capsulatus]